MYNTSKSLSLAFSLFILAISILPVAGEENYGNIPPDPNVIMMMGMSAMESIELPFNPNDYNFLIYDCGGDIDENSIQEAMDKLGLEYTVRTSAIGNRVTIDDLNTYDILIVGWAAGGNKDGLAPNVIEDGITGRVILSGHDSDYHTIYVEEEDAATTFFIQEIDYILKGGGTGLLVCADIDNTFDWLPQSWGVVANNYDSGTTIRPFTQEGLDSGVYDNLTPALMSGWGKSFHNYFTDWGIGFTAFELGQVGDSDKVVTIAATANPLGFKLWKTDDVDDGDCRSPGQEITYTICWDNQGDRTFSGAWIIDRLSQGVTYTGGPWLYDPNEHTCIIDIGDIGPGDANYVSLTVIVNSKAGPGMMLHNIAEMFAGDAMIARATEDTQVCCWDTGPIIYVDKNAVGNNNGISWVDAYTYLQDALARARDTQCADVNTIYIADGIYSPGSEADDTFEIPDDVSVYGGFAGWETSPDQRNIKIHPTVLTGCIDPNNRNEIIVIMGDETLLDGVVVQDSGFGQGILCEDVTATITNCTVKDNLNYGIYADNSSINLKWCRIENNGFDGIRHTGTGKQISIENCQINNNGRNGVRTINSTPIIRNTAICQNSFEEGEYYGVRISEPSSIPVIYNNTIAYNNNAAIRSATSDPNHPKYPDVQNCIIWYNNNGGEQLRGFDPEWSAYYNCIQDCNDVNFNISSDPKFAYSDLNNIHLAYDSPCKNSGNPSHSSEDVGLYDMDNESRIAYDRVDIGADEVNCEDVYNERDWNADGLVNLVEFNAFSRAWLSIDPNAPLPPTDPNVSAHWDSRCDLNGDYNVNLADLIIFIDDTPWLWTACWKQQELLEQQQMSMMGGGEQMLVLSEVEGMMSSTPSAPSDASQSAETAIPVIVEPIEIVPATEPIEPITIDPVVERENLLSLLEELESSIDETGPDSEGFLELKNFIEQVLVEMGDTTNDPNEV